MNLTEFVQHFFEGLTKEKFLLARRIRAIGYQRFVVILELSEVLFKINLLTEMFGQESQYV